MPLHMSREFRCRQIASAVGLLATIAAGPALAADCLVNQMFNPPGPVSCTVPNGITRIQVLLVGGGGGGSDGATGYAGSQVTTTITVVPGTTLHFIPGTGGGAGAAGGTGGAGAAAR